MSSATSARPMAQPVFVAAPHNGYPGPPEGTPPGPLYPHIQHGFYLTPGNLPGVPLPVSVQPAQRTLKEGKVLGAIQIVIGLLHIGLGVLMVIISGPYTAISFIGGYPFWGGLGFIISGSLSVSAERQPNVFCLLNGSLGMNIVSAVFSLTGITLCITDISINPYFIYPDHYIHWNVVLGSATSGLMLIFSLLEFCIACTAANFGCQPACSSQNEPVVFPNIYVATQCLAQNQ